MADISKYLEDILSAIYGEEVRHSIHDAIDAINKEVYTGVEDAKAEVAKATAEAAKAAASATSAQSSADSAAQSVVAAANEVSNAAAEVQKAKDEVSNAAVEVQKAKDEVSNAAVEVQKAKDEANRAKTEADNAAGSATSAASSASEAASSATLSRSWATGDTASRPGEENNNSKFYAEQAQRALSSISGSLVAMGTIPFEELPPSPLQSGVMYNISNEFTTDSRFNEGAGHKYGAGTNVYWTADSKWDCLAAGSAETNQINTVKVNGTPLVPDAEKAVDVKAYNEDNKPEVGGRNLLLNSGVRVTNSDYLMHQYDISDRTLKDGEKVTVTIKGTLGSGKTEFRIFNTYGYHGATLSLTDKGNGYYQASGNWSYSDGGNDHIEVYPIPQSVEAESTIEWIKLERGEIATDWSPAPEDLEAEIPKNISQLANDSGFITRNDIPEGIAASSTIPKASTETGDVGHELMFARGDHVHPYGNGIADSSPYAPPNGSGLRFAYSGDVDKQFGETVYPVLSGVPLSGGAPIFGAVTKTFYKQNIGYAEISDITASNFTGILPIEKGGTNNSHIHSDVDITPENFRGQIGQPHNSDFILPDRHIDSSLIGKYWLGYASGVKFGCGDTHGYLTTSYSEPDAVVGGGNDNKINWSKHLAFSDQIPSIATSTTAGLVKPGAGLQISDDGTLSVVDSGGGSGSTRYGTFMLTGIYGQGTQKDLLNVSFIKISGENPKDFFDFALVNASNIWKTIADEGEITFFSDNVYPFSQAGYYIHQTIFEFRCKFSHSGSLPIIDNFNGSISLTAITNDVAAYDNFIMLSTGLKEQLSSYSSSFYTVPASGVMNVTFKNIT